MLSLVRTDYVYRYHLFVDTEAKKFDAFRVELLEQSVLLMHDTPDELWRKVQTVMLEMRGQYDQRPLYHGLVFAPFARIIALDSARVSAESSLKISMLVGEEHPVHTERVRALGAALDALEFLGEQASRQEDGAVMDAHVVISQVDALRAREKFYFTGKECHRGHLSPRYAMSGNCAQCYRERDRRRETGSELSSLYGVGKEIREPRAWENDGGLRRESVIDYNFTPPRVIRHVGWRRSCMCCRKPFFSPDVARVRICLPCKDRPNATNFD